MELLKESVDYAIFFILGLMGFITVWLTIERWMFMRKCRPEQYATKTDYDTALTNNLTTLYIIYSNAPYVGLLGTVIGIMITFYDMGQSGNINASDIMTGLSLALKATALGLTVAIPTLIIYNGLQRKINVLSSRWDEQNAPEGAQA
ncbi:TonB-system energizer ExbB [Sutterella sp.]|uniref:TonB-system energizer ExbB n=1 Tax=Sutterella sp. TaxID=1981025 RepID=UPI0026E0DBFC|nr:TonB-system energizer ExbB [Sutterella sp.]MDO5531122.1 TonB-system energizer ExbB [Sutterella sp.]